MISKLYSGILCRGVSTATKKSTPKGRIEQLPVEGKSVINKYVYVAVYSAVLAAFGYKLYTLRESESKGEIAEPVQKTVTDLGTQYIKKPNSEI